MPLFPLLSFAFILTCSHVYGTKYVINVTTSRRLFSGTDAHVYINLIGSNGASTGSIRLHNSHRDFEFGRTDTFYRDAKYVGHLKAVKIYRNNNGAFPNWHLARITASYKGSPLYTFYFNRWIAAWRWVTVYEQNECRAGIAKCQHVCIDTKHKYYCACRQGYKLDGPYKCQDVNECTTGKHECDLKSTTCSNKVGNYSCPCRNGYKRYKWYGQWRYKCEDIDECSSETHSNKCEKLTTTCQNKIGSYACQCKTGYQPGQSPYKCEDVDECTSGKHKCDNQTTSCNNLDGSYVCLCKTGYEATQDQSLYKCQAKQCNESVPLGMESGQISNQSLTASSNYFKFPAWKARLNSGMAKSWYAFAEDRHPWIQVGLEKLTWLKAVATQGKMFSFFVKTYELAYSTDEVTWFTYGELDENNKKVGKVFNGNTDPYKVVKVELDKPVYTRFVRLYPQSWNDGVALKLELYGCSPE